MLKCAACGHPENKAIATIKIDGETRIVCDDALACQERAVRTNDRLLALIPRVFGKYDAARAEGVGIIDDLLALLDDIEATLRAPGPARERIRKALARMNVGGQS